MAAHSSVLARKFPWTEERGELLFMGSQRVRQDSTHTHTEVLGVSLKAVLPISLKSNN